MGLRERLRQRPFRRPVAAARPYTVTGATTAADAAWDATQPLNVGVPAEIDAAQSPHQSVSVNVESPRVRQPVPVAATRPVVDRVVYTQDYALHKVIQAIWLLVGFFEVMLAIRFLLRVLGANPENPFATFTYGLTNPLVWPFASLFGTPQAGVAAFEWSTIFAMIMYWLIGWLVTKLLALIWDRPVTHEVVARESGVPVAPVVDDTYVVREPVVREYIAEGPVVQDTVVRERIVHDRY